jgi:hypothetical protein
MPRRDLRLLLALAAVAPLLALGIEVIGSPDLLLVAPLLVLVLPLMAGRFVGEDALARLRGAVHAPRRTDRRSTSGQAERPSRVALPRGGRLIAFSLAVRPPPCGLAA